MDFTNAKSYLDELAMNHVAKLPPAIKKAPEAESQIPVISYATSQIFESLKSTKEKASILNTDMCGMVKTLEKTKAELQDAKEHTTRDNIYRFLLSALHVAAVTTAIFGIMGMVATGAGSAIAMCIGGSIAAYAFGNMNAALANCLPDHAEGIHFIGNALIGFAYPVYDALAKVDNLEESVIKQKAEIAQKHIGLLKFFKEKEFSEIQTELQARINASEVALENFNPKANPYLDPVRSLHKTIDDSKQALKEFEKAFAFYKK